jgi:hypothetical protein
MSSKKAELEFTWNRKEHRRPIRGASGRPRVAVEMSGVLPRNRHMRPYPTDLVRRLQD